MHSICVLALYICITMYVSDIFVCAFFMCAFFLPYSSVTREQCMEKDHITCPRSSRALQCSLWALYYAASPRYTTLSPTSDLNAIRYSYSLQLTYSSSLLELPFLCPQTPDSPWERHLMALLTVSLRKCVEQEVVARTYIPILGHRMRPCLLKRKSSLGFHAARSSG